MKVRKAGMLIAVALILVVAGALYATSLGDPGTSPDNPRFRAGVVLLSLSGSKEQVERYLRENGSLKGVGRRVSIQPSTYVGKNYVTDEGLLTVVDTRNEFVLMLEPSVKGETVEWKCSVMPTSVAPKLCRAQ